MNNLKSNPQSVTDLCLAVASGKGCLYQAVLERAKDGGRREEIKIALVMHRFEVGWRVWQQSPKGMRCLSLHVQMKEEAAIRRVNKAIQDAIADGWKLIKNAATGQIKPDPPHIVKPGPVPGPDSPDGDFIVSL